MEQFLKTTVLPILESEIPRIPFKLFQSMAIVGAFSVILILYRHQLFELSKKQVPHVKLGLIMGGAGFFLTFLLADHMTELSKPTGVLLDSIFIAGFIGGWRSALVTFGIASFSRYMFGGPENIYLAVASYINFIISGSLAHSFMFPKALLRFRYKDVALLILWHLGFTLLGILFMSFVFTDIPSLIYGLTAKSISNSLTSSAVTITIVLLLLNYEGQRSRQLLTNQVINLPNRKALQQYLTEMYEAKATNGNKRVFLLLEIDNAQQFVQTYGYEHLDKECGLLSVKLKNVIRTLLSPHHDAKLFAFSNQALAIVLSNINKTEIQQTKLAHKIFQDITTHMRKKNEEIALSFSLSVLDIALSADNPPAYFLRSISLLEKKGFARVQYFEPSIARQMQLEDTLRTQITQMSSGEGYAPLHLQPKVCLQNGYCYGAESLLRVVGGDSPSGYLNPQEVMAVAEKYKLQGRLEWSIIRSVIQCLAAMPPQLMHLKISVNITPNMLGKPSFAHQVLRLLRKNGVSPARFIIEIIETNKLVASDIVKENAQRLTLQGIILSLDDFGTGYSSIALLSQLPFKELKIDCSMTSRVQNKRGYDAIHLSVEGAKKYQAAVVAEGIETENQRNVLDSMGVLYGQGYLFAKPMPLQEFITYASSNTAEVEDVQKQNCTCSISQ